jgi:pilus assembly protein CpaB
MVKGRALVVVLALILATLATAGVFLYARGVEEDAKSGGTMVSVVVSEVDIPARTDLNTLIKDDLFRIIQVPQTAKVDGAVTSIDQLTDKNNAVAILAGEQIPVARITGNLQGGALSIPENMQAVTVPLDAPRAVAGVINPNDQVVIYSSFKDAPIALRDLPVSTPVPVATARRAAAVDWTVVLVPSAQILAVHRPLSQSVIGQSDEASQAEQLPGSVAVTLALSHEDAENFVFSMEMGTVWLGLLPPDESGESLEPISYAQVAR